MKILDRYVLGEFLRAFAGILAVFGLLLLLNEVLGTLGEIKVDNPNMGNVILFFVYKLPAELLEVVPITVILAVMFGIGGLAKKKELLAMHASGISYVRLVIPILIAIVAISGLSLYVGEAFVPELNERARWIEKVDIEGKKPNSLTREKNIITKGKDKYFYSMKSYDSAAKRMELPSITEQFEKGHALKMRLDAAWAVMVGSPGDNGSTRTLAAAGEEASSGDTHLWRFHNAVRWTFNESNELIRREAFPEIEVPMEAGLDEYLATNRKSKELAMGDLIRMAAIHGERDKGGEYFQDVSMELHGRLAFPFGTLLLGLIGYTFAVRSSIRSYVLEFGAALGCVTLYYVCMLVGQKAGASGALPPFVAVWYANILFFGYLVWRFRQIHRVPER